ncbi:Type IV secretion system protein virB4 [Rickettsiales bacterium Ac37b]|nr:Type IV secretion system protein virB4 [Rickettsiales bacterium Ac37b]
MIKLAITRTKKHKYAEKEYSAGHFIPYHCHWNKNTILTKKEELMQIIRIGGFSFETADDEDVDIRKNIRNLLFKNMSSGNLAIYFHTIRRKQSIVSSDDDFSMDPNIKISQNFATYVEDEWRKKHISHLAYVNELYVTIIRKADTKGAAIVEHLLKKFKQRTDKTAWEADMKEAYEELEEMVGRIMTTFRDYNPELLGVVKTKHGVFSEMLEFLGKIANCGVSIPVRYPHSTIDHYLPHHRLYFGNKSIEVRGAMGRKYAGIVSIKEYGPTTSAGQFDGFLQLPFEFIMTQSFTFTNRQVAINKMQLQQNRMIQSADKAVSQIAEISQALDMAMSGDIGFGEHHLTVMCIEDTPKSLENALAQTVVELSNGGIQAIREKMNLEPCYWGQLPGNYSYIVRKAVINTLNLAGFASQHNYPPGKPKGNHWGDAVTVLDTTSGTPYFFSFHVRDVGHTLIIGPTGAGKTVLMNFLCAQAQKFKCRMFFFDKDRGAEIFIRALGGVHINVDPSKPCGFNPLQLKDSGENRTFILEWLKILVTIHGEILSSEDIMLLSSAVEGNYKLAQKDRVLRNIAPFLGMETGGSIASRLAMWHSKGSHARVFDNKEDYLDLEKERIFGFEMAELLKNPICLGPVLLYLFHKINISLDGTPTMIVLDEAWALIDNPIFAPKIKDWLKVLRKLNTFVIFATQSVEDASKSAISDTLIQQTATQIFLPNLKATSVYRTAFMLSEREYILIKTTDPASRFFLVKQGTNSIVGRIDLSGMNNIINVLSGRTETVLLLDEIRKEVGDDPDVWLPIFYERVNRKND